MTATMTIVNRDRGGSTMDRTELARFKAWGFDAQDWARRTRDMYAGNVRRADRWLRAHDRPPLAEADPDDLKAFLYDLSTSPSTRNNYRCALIGFFKWQADLGREGDNPAEQLPRYRVPRPVPKAMTVDAVNAILAAAHDWGPMWVCAVTMLLFGGMRSSEARTVEWTDIAGRWMTFVQKGGQERALPLHDRIAAALDAWKPYCPDPTFVYPSPRIDGQPVSEAWWSRVIARIGDAAGLQMRLHPHLCRHTAATQLLENGADVRAVQEFLGHASLSSTQRYTHVRPQRLVDTVDRLDY